MIVGIAFISIFFICGFIVFLTGLKSYTFYQSTVGEIIAFDERISFQDSSHDDHPANTIWYIPVVRYSVGGKEYLSEMRDNKAWKEIDFGRSVKVLFDPDKPEKAYTKLTYRFSFHPRV